MSDVEARLRRTLREGLDGVVADPGRAATTVRRARRRRALRGVAAGLAGVLLAGVAATAWEGGREDPPPPPAAEPEQVATFAVDFDPGTGTVTVDVPKAQICFDLSRDIRMQAQLRYDFAGAGDVAVVATGLPARPGVPRCHAVDPDHAERLLADPFDHLVVLSPGYLTRSAPLEPLATAPEDAPDVVKIVCSQDGAVAITPQVQPQEDGIHLRFYGSGDRWRAFNLLNDDGVNEGGELHGGEFVSTFPPGAFYAGCFDHLNEASMSPRDPAYTRITIVDPVGLWTEEELDCETPDRRRAIVTDELLTNDEPDYEALIRDHVEGVEPDDVLERPRYPRSEFVFEMRTVVRDGRRIAWLMVVREEPFWAVSPHVCPGSGIAPPS